MKTVTCSIYAGSFDPPTLGHLWIIERGAAMFDELIVAVGTNPAKNLMFSSEERIEMLEELTKDIKNVRITEFPNKLLVDYAIGCEATHILRGVRNYSDFEYEYQMKQINHDFAPNIETVLLIPPRGLAEISSSLVKSLVGFEGWKKLCSKYVPDIIIEKLGEKT